MEEGGRRRSIVCEGILSKPTVWEEHNLVLQITVEDSIPGSFHCTRG